MGTSIVDLYVYLTYSQFLSHLPWPEDPSWAPWASPESATYRGPGGPRKIAPAGKKHRENMRKIFEASGK